ncbi:CDP-diacylglycerol--glycerol-3-phosphate 3-phosphatidyltransferase [Nonlabens xylanidelens]|uniref:CDP-diacylglycerol--glycerol-3-phosphate 3-phosphatidyltransferase n=1 Tax=Nonlabens xylanidelens TaxID=191564 RepID=A0A2S6IN39_9FLAO|nr:CDP-alcohol phosphatidyltransferase family protein [Nonlabens xylanidelens]PPK95601.1 CDP-diacylglycerol--glycerol-3-phosphate 3-phosphatidyltransferase [Nonlabens xylanidelens]PQJ22404.1 CDP-alcohol phosphatidyltransferase [Nonlabens xylanidelens]
MNIPKVLILFRLLLAPIILGLAYFIGDDSKTTIIVLMYLGLISDILDGIVARKQGVSSTSLRRMDSQTDMVFWLSIGFATWILYPQLIANNYVSIYVILVMEVACYVISLVKFKKETCTHAFLSKLWGITLLVAFTSLIGFNHSGIPFALAIVMGIISHIDRILITIILPKWTHDIPSAYHAYLIRKGIDFKRNDLLNG